MLVWYNVHTCKFGWFGTAAAGGGAEQVLKAERKSSYTYFEGISCVCVGGDDDDHNHHHIMRGEDGQTTQLCYNKWNECIEL